MNTSPENSPTHDVLETALTERLRSEAAGLALRWKAFTATHRPDISEPLDQTEWHKALSRLQLEATRLSKKDVIGLKEVGSVVKRITGPDMPRPVLSGSTDRGPPASLPSTFRTSPRRLHSTAPRVPCCAAPNSGDPRPLPCAPYSVSRTIAGGKHYCSRCRPRFNVEERPRARRLPGLWAPPRGG